MSGAYKYRPQYTQNTVGPSPKPATVTDRHRKLASEIRAFTFEWINLTTRDMPWDVLDSKIAKMLAENEAASAEVGAREEGKR